VLWDRRSRRIVNNESLEIAHMLNHAFDDIGGDRDIDLCPAHPTSAMDELNGRITRSLAIGVYSIAGAKDQREYDAAMDELFGFLDELDERLADGRPFLLGAKPTLADILAYASRALRCRVQSAVPGEPPTAHRLSAPARPRPARPRPSRRCRNAAL
jgi:glutathionyl-hydroquinone reductase